jgi:hypothetical protein
MAEPDDPSRRPESPQPSQGEPPQSEEELRARIEEQLRTVRIQDLLLESVVGILNLAARRIAKEDERDLEQARVGIEATRAVVDLLDPEQAEQVRAALAQVQMLYAKQAEDGGSEPEDGEPEPPPQAAREQEDAEAARRRGTARGPSKLWTPPGT